MSVTTKIRNLAFSLVVWYALLTYQSRRGVQEGAFFLTLLLFAGLTIIGEFLRPKPPIENAQPAGLGDFSFPTATEGRPVPIIWGKNRIKGPNVVWYGDFFQDPITQKVKTGLFSSQRITKGYRYNIGMQLAICRGPDVVLKKVYIGDEEVFSGTVSTVTTFNIDKPDLFGGNELGNGGTTALCEFYPGTASQAKSDYLARFQDSGAGSTRTPRYTGTCYIVARQLGSVAATARGAYIGNSTNISAWTFECERYPAIFSGQSSGENKIGVDCNPVNVLYEILTNDEWGLGFNNADIDVGISSSFLSAADTCITEGNGFSMVLDQSKTVSEMINVIEKQIDGNLYLDQRTGKWKIALARQDYDVDLVHQLNSGNISEITEYVPGAWEDTSNIVRVKFDKREDEYKTSYAIAQNIASTLTLGGGTVTTGYAAPVEMVFPGIKDADNAAKIAWRELKSVSYPLARATLKVNREFWDLHVGSPVAWTDTTLGFTKKPFRVTNINFGTLTENTIELQLVQDIFGYQAAGFGSPSTTNWTPPSDTLVAIPSDQQLAFEAPRAIQARDPDFDGDFDVARIWCGARRQSNEAQLLIRQRNSSGTPSGSFVEAGEVSGFIKIGSLKSNLANGTATPTTSITIESSPDSQVDLEDAFVDTVTQVDMGVDLANLIMVGDEFMLVSSASVSGSDVVLSNVYRGVLDSVQSEHSAGDDVYLIFAGGNLASTSFPKTRNVDIKLLPDSRTDTLAEGSATTISVAVSKRNTRPIPPSNVKVNGSTYPSTAGYEDAGSGFDGFKFDLTWNRRDFRIFQEVDSLTIDAATVNTDFPAANSTEYRVTVYGNPSAENDQLLQSAWVNGSSAVTLTRTTAISESTAGGSNGGEIPTELRVLIETRHDVDADSDLTSRHNQDYTFAVTSALTSQSALGSLAPNVTSESYVDPSVSTPGNYTVTIGTAFTTSNVQVRINAGSWTTVIAAASTSGLFAVSAGDTLEFRHTAADGVTTFFEVKDPANTPVAYGVFHD